MKPNTVKYIFFGIILFIFIGLLYTNVAGKKQDEVFKQDFLQYQQAMQLIQNNELEQGIKILGDLIIRYPDEHKLYYNLGLAYSAKQDYEKAATHYQQAIDIRPALLQDGTFTYRMGESLYNMKELEIAREYLQARKAPKELEKERKKLIKQINKQLKS